LIKIVEIKSFLRGKYRKKLPQKYDISSHGPKKSYLLAQKTRNFGAIFPCHNFMGRKTAIISSKKIKFLGLKKP
jgi:hypothetical protein